LNRLKAHSPGVVTAPGRLVVEACCQPPPAPCPRAPEPTIPGGLQVRGSRFYRDGKAFFIKGFNYWSALPLLTRDGSESGVGWDLLRRDLDVLQGAGINVLRILGATEGPDTEPLRIVPSLQPSRGHYDPRGVAALLRLVAELERRQLFAIVVMNNFWHWSGGMAQYLAWAGEGPIPYPPPRPGGSWDEFQKYASRFYENPKATRSFADLLGFLVPQLASSPAVIWELANEPRGIDNVKAYRTWIDDTACLIKSLAPNQLVTTGSEGQTATPAYAGTDVVRDHRSGAIDFITFHMWAQNWGWVRPEKLAEDFPEALERAREYVTRHATLAAQLDKPILLEELGFPRDGGSFEPDSPTTLRDRYFQEVFTLVRSLMTTTPMAGLMPWAWAGDTRPPRPGQTWKPGDPFTGDPPHEPQGWYSIYTADSTLEIIKDLPMDVLS